MIESWAEKYQNEKNDRCWFCSKNGCDEFDTELDTFLHKQCLILELKNNPYNTEAQLMDYLLDKDELEYAYPNGVRPEEPEWEYEEESE